MQAKSLWECLIHRYLITMCSHQNGTNLRQEFLEKKLYKSSIIHIYIYIQSQTEPNAEFCTMISLRHVSHHESSNADPQD